MNSITPRYELRHISGRATITWRSQVLVTANSNSTSFSGAARQEGVIQRDAGLVRLLVDELAAHPVTGCQIADRLRSRQRQNGQILTLSLGQPRCCTNAPIHTRTIPEKVRVPSSARGSANPAASVTLL